MARQRANSSSVFRSTRGWSPNPCGSPALRSTAEARTPDSSNLRKLLPEKRKCLFIGLLRFERSHIDRKTILHIGFEQSHVSFVDLLDRDNFDISGDIVLSAEIE